MEGKINNLEEEVKKLSSQLKEAEIDSSSGKDNLSDKDKIMSIDFTSWKPWAIILGIELLWFLWLEWQYPSVEPSNFEEEKDYSLPNMEDLDDNFE